MTRVRQPDEAGSVDPAIRHRVVPARELGDKLVVARPRDGAPVVLASTATIVWRALDDWTTTRGIDRRLDEVFPGVAAPERDVALARILAALDDDDLLERA